MTPAQLPGKPATVRYPPAKRPQLLALAGTMAGCVFVAGCNPDRSEIVDLRQRIVELEGEVRELRFQLDEKNELIQQQKEQIATLQTVPQDVISLIEPVASLQLDQTTDLLDTAGDPAPEAVRVVAFPADKLGNPLKFPGRFDARVFDLLAPDGPREIARRQIDAREVNELWYDTLFGRYYSFEVPLEQQPRGSELVVRVEFTDLIRGTKHNARADIKVPASATRPATGD